MASLLKKYQPESFEALGRLANTTMKDGALSYRFLRSAYWRCGDAGKCSRCSNIHFGGTLPHGPAADFLERFWSSPGKKQRLERCVFAGINFRCQPGTLHLCLHGAGAGSGYQSGGEQLAETDTAGLCFWHRSLHGHCWSRYLNPNRAEIPALDI